MFSKTLVNETEKERETMRNEYVITIRARLLDEGLEIISSGEGNMDPKAVLMIVPEMEQKFAEIVKATRKDMARKIARKLIGEMDLDKILQDKLDDGDFEVFFAGSEKEEAEIFDGKTELPPDLLKAIAKTMDCNLDCKNCDKKSGKTKKSKKSRTFEEENL
jgi:hypothetical protein